MSLISTALQKYLWVYVWRWLMWWSSRSGPPCGKRSNQQPVRKFCPEAQTNLRLPFPMDALEVVIEEIIGCLWATLALVQAGQLLTSCFTWCLMPGHQTAEETRRRHRWIGWVKSASIWSRTDCDWSRTPTKMRSQIIWSFRSPYPQFSTRLYRLVMNCSANSLSPWQRRLNHAHSKMTFFCTWKKSSNRLITLLFLI